ncbi:MAG: rhodanese-like domain-containing protein [Chloroflexota bacterium]|nr:rhodanese-like domain-containing protein [Chloroflexota bacterium]
MSQRPGQPPRSRRVSTARNAPTDSGYEDYQEEEEEYGAYEEQHPQPRRRGAGSDRPVQSSRGYSSGGRGGGSARPRSVQPPPDRFPYVIGALIGLAVAGLLGVAYLLGTGSKGGNTSPSAAQLPQAGTNGSGSQAAQPAASTGKPPRIALADFKKMYDDPAKRPLIIDVRGKDVYDQGHIKGAISLPQADIDSRVAELPKDKFIVAYCQ